jgi:eukaryotic-like serine/threonine-protein kinase
MQESLGDYRILEWIGAGGSAEVFRARDTRLGRTAAIKVLTADEVDDPDQRKRFLDEAALAAALGHPNVAALYEIGEQDGHPYLVFEFIQGQTLSGLLAGRPLNARRALEFAIQIADALADAHATGLVHHALRPDKIIVSLKGTAKTIDFGLGHYAMAVARRLATTSTPVSAMAYWPPEQIAGASGDPRLDIYALGLVLREMLTGRPPSADAQAATMAGVPAEVQPILAGMTSLEPARRPDSAATVAADLRAVAAKLDAKRERMTVPSAPTARKVATSVPRWLIAGLAVIAIAVLIWLAGR